MATTLPPGGGQSEPARRQAAAQCFVRAQEVFKREDFDYAIKLLKDACKLHPEQLVYRQALRASAKKKFDNNKRGSRMAAVTTMTSRAGFKSARGKKDWNRALECAEDILSENPWDSGVLLDVAAVFESLELLDHSVWSAELALEKDPTDAHVNRALAHFYERRGLFTKAIDCWERVKKKCPADEEADRRMKDLAASATIDKGGYEGAKSFTRAIADKGKTQELVEETKGGTGEHRYANQLAELQQKIQSKPTELAPYMQVSQIYRRQNKFDQAREIMEQAKAASGGHADAITELEDIEMDRLKADMAVARKLAQEKPGDSEGVKRVQEMARTLNDFELRAYQRRSDRNPTDMNLKVEVGIRLANAQQFQQAIQMLQQARSGAPGRKADIALWIGRCFQASKRFNLARKQYEEALEALAGGNPESIKDVHYRLGRVCEEMGDKPAATQHYEEVAAQDYAYRDVAARLDGLSQAGEDDADAGGTGAAPPTA